MSNALTVVSGMQSYNESNWVVQQSQLSGGDLKWCDGSLVAYQLPSVTACINLCEIVKECTAFDYGGKWHRNCYSDHEVAELLLCCT